MAAASSTVKRVFLELGGKSAMIMLDDAEPEFTPLIAAMTICSHAGQGCAITSRLLVPRSQHDEIVAKVPQHLEGVTVGDPSDPAVYMGPLLRDRKSVVSGKRVSVRVDLGGRRTIKKKHIHTQHIQYTTQHTRT